MNYLDFELRISSSGGQYSAHVYNSPGGQASNAFSIPLSKDRLELLILRLSRSRTANRQIDSPELEAARELGEALFNAVFHGGVRDVLRSSLEKYRQFPNTGLRLKLRLQDAPELANLPWEFLYDSDLRRFLAQSVFTPIVRYIELPESIRPLRTALPLRILGMISAPNDCTKLDVHREQSLVMEALQPLIKAEQVQITWLENAMLKSLRHGLQTGEFNIFHFIGHGAFDKLTQRGVLLFEDEQGRSAHVDAERLGVLLHDHASLRLAILNACEGARNSPFDPFTGVATTLAVQGLPAVVAMQFSISDEAAITFSGEFYNAVAQGFPVDSAVAEARKAIFTELSDVEWGTPVLFMRAEDGVLFEMMSAPIHSPEAPSVNSSEVFSRKTEVFNDQVERTSNASKPAASPPPPSSRINQPEKESQGKADLSGKERLNSQSFRLDSLDILGKFRMSFIKIPAGVFLTGSREVQNDFGPEKPEHKDLIPYDFWIGKYPITNEQYAPFVQDTGLKHPAGSDWKQRKDHPVTFVDWNAALLYCQWLERQCHSQLPSNYRIALPSEAEWEKAARGVNGNQWPWGNNFDKRCCNTDEAGVHGTTPVGAYSPAGDSPFGCSDMAGNVWEWTRNLWETTPSYMDEVPGEDLQKNYRHVIRGGSAKNNQVEAHCAFRGRYDPFIEIFGNKNLIGFRVVVIPSSRL